MVQGSRRKHPVGLRTRAIRPLHFVVSKMGQNTGPQAEGCRLGPVRNDYFVTINCGLLLSVPDGVTTETVPVVALAGTVAWM